jgi:hypothetical protein
MRFGLLYPLPLVIHFVNYVKLHSPKIIREIKILCRLVGNVLRMSKRSAIKYSNFSVLPADLKEFSVANRVLIQSSLNFSLHKILSDKIKEGSNIVLHLFLR